MKHFFITLFLCLLLLSNTAEASPTKMGRLYDLVIDPCSPNHNADKNAYINWARQNFDEHNIPLISTIRLFNEGSNTTVGIDSAYKYNPLYAQVRRYAWTNYTFAGDQSNAPRIVFNPWYFANELGNSPAGMYNRSFEGVASQLSVLKQLIDNVEAEMGGVAAAVPLKVTSEFKDGSIQGKVDYSISQAVASAFHNFVTIQGSPATRIAFQIFLVEGYHRYGQEEAYFIPRKTTNTSQALGGTMVDFPSTARTGSLTFDFPIDKSYNTKYLYVLAIAEIYPADAYFNSRLLLDAAVDKVVNVVNPAIHTPIKLDLSFANQDHRCRKVFAGTQNVPISFVVTNPTSSQVTATVYVDKNTSAMNGWVFNPIAQPNITIPAGGNTVVTLTGKAPFNGGTAAIDFCVLPTNTKENENPIISNILAVVGTDSTRVIALLPNNAAYFMEAFYSNSYSENISIVPQHFYSAIIPSMFDAYIVEAASLTQRGTFDPAIPYGSNFVVPGTMHINNIESFTKDQELMMEGNYMEEGQVKFLNSAIAAGKHLALFTNRSPYYATTSMASPSAKTEYATLYNNFGVSFKQELKMRKNNNDSGNAFAVNASSTEQIAHRDVPLSFVANNSNFGVFDENMSFVTDWNITNISKASKAYYYDNDLSSTAAVKATHNNSRLFLAGFCVKKIFPTEVTKLSSLMENITEWWFGVKPKLEPKIDLSRYDIDFGDVDWGTSVERTVIVSNLATAPENVLRILGGTGFDGDVDGSFSVARELKYEIQAGESDTLILKFSPQSGVPYNLKYKIYSNGQTNKILDIDIKGKGNIVSTKPPTIEVDPQDMYENFTPDAPAALNSQGKPKDYYIFNSGDLPLEIYNIELDADGDIYNLTNLDEWTGAIINGGQHKILKLAWKPVKSGHWPGYIHISSNDDNRPILSLEIESEVDVSISEEIARMFKCNVSPNPAYNEIILDFEVIGELSRNVVLNIIDNTGSLVKNISNNTYSPGNYQRQIDISKLAVGVYYIEYTIDEMKDVIPITIAR